MRTGQQHSMRVVRQTLGEMAKELQMTGLSDGGDADAAGLGADEARELELREQLRQLTAAHSDALAELDELRAVVSAAGAARRRSATR